MRTHAGLVIGLVGAVLMAAPAVARDSCDDMTFSSRIRINFDASGTTDGGLTFGGKLPAVVDLDGDVAAQNAAAAEECGFAWSPTDNLLFSNFRVDVDPGFILSAPGSFGVLETGAPAHVPGYTLPVNYSGFKLGAGISAQVNYDKFVPMDLTLGVEYGQYNGKGSEGAHAGSYGIPSVGLINGSPVGSVFGISSTDITTSRSFFGLDKQLHVPIFGGQHEWMGMDTDYVGYLIGGGRIGAINETQQIRIASTPGSVTYDNSYSGGYGGAYVGFGVDKTMRMPNSDMVLGANASIALGADMHRYHVVSSVGGSIASPSTNTYDVTDWVPTLKLGAGLSLVQKNFTFNVNGSVSSGYYPIFIPGYPVSNVHTAPTFDAQGVVDAMFDVGVTMSF